MRIRPLADDDIPFLWEMLHAALDWADDERFTPDEVRTDPSLSKLVDEWGRDGDRGLVFESDDGRPVGGAWYRWWTAANHAFGYVADNIPEIGIAMKSEVRGAGHGERLLAAILDLARGEGIQQVSLAVEQANLRALSLYAKAGFRLVRSGDADHIMVLDL